MTLAQINVKTAHYWQLYVGNGNLQKNQSNFVVVDSLSHRQQTIAYVNGVVEKVDYLIVLDEGLDINRLSGPLYVGGFVDVSLLPVSYFLWQVCLMLKINVVKHRWTQSACLLIWWAA